MGIYKYVSLVLLCPCLSSSDCETSLLYAAHWQVLTFELVRHTYLKQTWIEEEEEELLSQSCLKVMHLPLSNLPCISMVSFISTILSPTPLGHQVKRPGLLEFILWGPSLLNCRMKKQILNRGINFLFWS